MKIKKTSSENFAIAQKRNIATILQKESYNVATDIVNKESIYY